MRLPASISFKNPQDIGKVRKVVVTAAAAVVPES